MTGTRRVLALESKAAYFPQRHRFELDCIVTNITAKYYVTSITGLGSINIRNKSNVVG